jgi:hypothetical protein
VTVSQGETVVIDYDFTLTPPPHLAAIELAADIIGFGPRGTLKTYILVDGFEAASSSGLIGGSGYQPVSTNESVQMVLYDITGSFGISAYWLSISRGGQELDQIFHPATILIDPPNIPQITNLGPPPNLSPLPASLPLFATGLGVMGLFGWRRKRKNAAAIAGA